MKGWLDAAIHKAAMRGVEKGLKEAFAPDGVATRTIREILGVDLPDDAPMNEGQFVFAMSQYFAQAGVKNPDEAKRLAAGAYREYLASEGIKFGDPAYGWDRSCARIVANEMEIDHWEARP